MPLLSELLWFSLSTPSVLTMCAIHPLLHAAGATKINRTLFLPSRSLQSRKKGKDYNQIDSKTQSIRPNK